MTKVLNEVAAENEGLVESIVEAAFEKMLPLAMAQIVPEVIHVHERQKAAVKKEEARKRVQNTKQLYKHYKSFIFGK